MPFDMTDSDLAQTTQLVELLEKELTGLARGLGLNVEPGVLRDRLNEKLVHLCKFFSIDAVPDETLCKQVEAHLRREISTLKPSGKSDILLLRKVAFVAFNVGQPERMSKMGLTDRVNAFGRARGSSERSTHRLWHDARNQLAERIARNLASQYGLLSEC